jgi:SAM-dependent methyltransferase
MHHCLSFSLKEHIGSCALRERDIVPLGVVSDWLFQAGNMQNAHPSEKPYIFSIGEKAVSRLDLLEQIFGLATRHLLSAVGLRSGMRVAEIGCGIGLTARWVSTQVSRADPWWAWTRATAHRRKKCGNRRHHKSFIPENAYDSALSRDSFDLVYSRFLLCHLTDPAKALAEMSSLLTRGGILVCEDHDDGGIFTEPPTHAYKRLVEISDAVNRSHGLDSYVGLKPRLFREAGFGQPEAEVNQIVVLRGEEKRFWELTLREAAPAILDARASISEELDAICEEMR